MWKWSEVLRLTGQKISHFRDVLPSQSLGSVLKKTKLNQTNLQNTKPKWSRLTQEHTKIQTKPLQKHRKSNVNLTKYKYSFLRGKGIEQLHTRKQYHNSHAPSLKDPQISFCPSFRCKIYKSKKDYRIKVIWQKPHRGSRQNVQLYSPSGTNVNPQINICQYESLPP